MKRTRFERICKGIRRKPKSVAATEIVEAFDIDDSASKDIGRACENVESESSRVVKVLDSRWRRSWRFRRFLRWDLASKLL